ncbi:hypothetical protein GCM10027435_00680 [Haloparvum alkalitolerans]|uniref:universal stress protein n=1 Tax=Haloparvum alkalitolerans TaxID=1042953 RepID=UPI003CF48094
MYHVLLGVDDDGEMADRVAGTVADLPGGADEVTVSVFHAFTDNPAGASAAQVAGVRRAQERLEEAGIETTVLEASGDPAEELLEAAADHDADMIVIGGRRRSPAGKALFGSVAQTVILNADRPVLVGGRPTPTDEA